MWAVTVNRTNLNFAKENLCKTHKFKVEKNHIDECIHLKMNVKVTEFNEDLKSQKLLKINLDRLRKLNAHFTA